MSLPSSSVSPRLTDVSESGDPPFPPRKRRSTLNAWSWEIVLLIFAAGLLASVFVALGQQDGKPSQGWALPKNFESLNLALPRNLSLNTLVAILSTFLRASMVATAASIISQGKWVWYWDKTVPARPLRNLQHFEDASRGIWGSIKLLPIVLRHSVAALVAALIIILSFSIGPFIQQSVRTVAQEIAVEGQMSSLPVTYSMKLTSDYSFDLLDDIMFSSRVKPLIFSILGNPSTKDSNISADCSTGNCDFPSWENGTPTSLGRFINAASVGVCNSCVNATPLTTTTTQNVIYEGDEYVTTFLPNGMKIDQSGGHESIAFTSGDLSWADQLYGQETRAPSRWAYVNVTVLSYTLGQQGGVSRFQKGAESLVCSLYPCLRAYSAFVRGGKLDETVLQSTPLYPDIASGNNLSDMEPNCHFGTFSEIWFLRTSRLAAVQEPCRVENTIYTASNISQFNGSNSILVRLLEPNDAHNCPTRRVPQQCLFQVEIPSYMLLSSFLTKEIFANSTCSWDINQSNSIDCGERWWLGQFWEGGNVTTDTIKARFDAIADSLTAQIRLGFAREPGSTNHIAGTTLQTVPFTVIAWPWLIFPTVMLLVEALVLLGMIVGTCRGREDEMVWKSNLLPFVFHRDRFLLETREETVCATNGTLVPNEPLQTTQEMEKEAKKMKAKFTRHRVYACGQQSDGKAWNHRLKKSTRIQDSDLDSLLMDEDMELRPLPEQNAGQ